jgi:hypothetical protein
LAHRPPSLAVACQLQHGGFSWAIEKELDVDLEQVEQDLAGAFEGKWISHVFKEGEAAVRVSFGQNHKGLAAYRYWYEEIRVDRKTLLTLTCPQSDCPKHRELWDKLQEQRGLPPQFKDRGKQQDDIFVTHLAEERWTDHDGQKVLARRASVHKQVACPHAVHTPKTINTPAWDLFDLSGRFVATVSVINTAQHN